MATSANPPGSPGQSVPPAAQAQPAPPSTNQQSPRVQRRILVQRIKWWVSRIVAIALIVIVATWGIINSIKWYQNRMPEAQFTSLDAAKKMAAFERENARLRAENAALKASESTGRAKPADELVRVPKVDTDSATNTSEVASKSLALTNDATGALVHSSSNVINVKATADRSGRITVNIGERGQTEKSDLINPDIVVELNPLEWVVDALTGFYCTTNVVKSEQKVLFTIPRGWDAFPTHPYSTSMVKMTSQNGKGLKKGDLPSGNSVFIHNLSETVNINIRWECITNSTYKVRPK